MLDFGLVDFFILYLKSSHNTFYLKSDAFEKAHTATQYLSYFCNKIYPQVLSKIAQSGHTVGNNVACPNEVSTF